MKNKFMTSGILFLTFLLFGYIFLSPSVRRTEHSVRELTEWTLTVGTGESSPVSLPLTLKNLAPRTAVTLTTSVYPEADSQIYLKTVYSPVRVYADGELIFSYGQDGTYAPLLLDPPTKVELLPLAQTGRPITLRLEFLSPSQRDTMTVHPVLSGTADAILERLFSDMGFSLFFSIVLIALGIFLSLIAVVLARIEKTGKALLPLGIFSFLVGTWILGECNLTALFIDNPSLLYLAAFLSLFTMAVPLLKFGMIILHFPICRRLLRYTYIAIRISICAAILLQLMGTVSLSRSMYLFHILIPAALCVFAGCILWEALRCKNPLAIQFLFPVTLLSIFSVLEVINYYTPRRPVQISFFFQTGMLLFVCSLCIQCGSFALNSFRTRAENRQLSYELSLMEMQIRSQKERYDILLKTDASIKAQRHDLKHQLAVIRSYNENRQPEKLAEYLNSLIANIPVNKEERLCENNAVNAVALYYQTIAEKAGISSLSIRLGIPFDTGQVQESDLCVLIGNLLENAIAACQDALPEKEPPFIRMQSRLQYGILTITMDNRCIHAKQTQNGLFESQKPGGGTGLISIRSIAKRYGGDARFELKNHIFFSSVYLRISDGGSSGEGISQKSPEIP